VKRSLLTWLLCLALKTPIISTVDREGGSGGALANWVFCDELMMLQYGTYLLISPEGCASIFVEKRQTCSDAAKRWGLRLNELSRAGFVELLSRALGGAAILPHEQIAEN